MKYKHCRISHQIYKSQGQVNVTSGGNVGVKRNMYLMSAVQFVDEENRAGLRGEGERGS